MIEKEVITRRLTALEEYLADLNKAKNDLNFQEFKTDKIMRRYIERTLHMAIESCLDTASHIISYKGYREAENNQDLFQILIEESILDKDLGKKLKKMAQFRNVIVHDYLKIDPEIVFAILTKHTDDLSRFALVIKDSFLS